MGSVRLSGWGAYRRFFESEAGIERERAGQVFKAADVLLHRVALAAPRESNDRHLGNRERLHFMVDRLAFGRVELGAPGAQHLLDLGYAQAEAADVGRREAAVDDVGEPIRVVV